MRGLIDLIIGAFIAFLPLFFLLLRRRRAQAGGRPGVQAPKNEMPEDEMPASETLPGEPVPGSAPPGVAPVQAVPRRGVPAEAARVSDIEAPVSKEAAPATAWERVNRLSPGRRAIVMAEIISKPLALRDRQPWS